MSETELPSPPAPALETETAEAARAPGAAATEDGSVEPSRSEGADRTALPADVVAPPMEAAAEAPAADVPRDEAAAPEAPYEDAAAAAELHVATVQHVPEHREAVPEEAEMTPVETPAASALPAAAVAAGDAAAPAERGPRTVGFDRSVEERKQRAEQHWLHVSGARDSGEAFEGVVTAPVKGGLLVDIGGIRGFLPASQTRLEAGAALESLVKTKVPLVVIDVDAKRRRIVVSQRRALEDLRRSKRTALLRSLQIGQLHEGTVVRLAPFGAFVDIGGLEGLVPMSELAFERVERVEDLLKVGERVAVAVLRLDATGKKIALSRKNALPDPLRDHAALLRPGNVIEGKVVGKDTKLEVEIAPGVIGSVRESDADPAQYELGETVEVSVRFVDRRNRRIVLTTLHGAAALPAPQTTGFASLGEELRRRK